MKCPCQVHSGVLATTLVLHCDSGRTPIEEASHSEHFLLLSLQRQRLHGVTDGAGIRLRDFFSGRPLLYFHSPDRNTHPLRLRDLRLHPAADMRAEHPQLITAKQHRQPHVHSRLPLLRNSVVQNRGVQQMGRKKACPHSMTVRHACFAYSTFRSTSPA